jgi:predicted amidophosphoribosyltransferase
MSFVADLRYVIESAADRALDLALPVTCAGCYLSGTTLCRDCRAALELRLGAGTGVPTGLASELPAPLFQLEWCAPFAGITRRALERLSDAGERRMSGPLGEGIANRWAKAGAGGDVLVPVPAAADRVRERGYDQAVLLARVAGRRLRLPVIEALRRAPNVAPMFGLVQAGQGVTVGKDFEVIAAARISGHSVVLVDDVVTTGATLSACATALLRAGARVVSAVTVARDRLAATEPVAREMGMSWGYTEGPGVAAGASVAVS